jgi:hypothetical protein
MGTVWLSLKEGDIITVKSHFEDVTVLHDLPVDEFCSIVYIGDPPVENTVVDDLIVDVDYHQNIVGEVDI